LVTNSRVTALGGITRLVEEVVKADDKRSPDKLEPNFFVVVTLFSSADVIEVGNDPVNIKQTFSSASRVCAVTDLSNVDALDVPTIIANVSLNTALGELSSLVTARVAKEGLIDLVVDEEGSVTEGSLGSYSLWSSSDERGSKVSAA